MAKDEHRIIITHATELKPGAKYLIAFDRGSLTEEDAHNLTHALKAMGIDNAIAVLTDGNPSNVMKVVEQEA
jgi:CRISPR/Cas system type I-B associated protein Csh2 (Cas7 group RAMP superfamily)